MFTVQFESAEQMAILESAAQLYYHAKIEWANKSTSPTYTKACYKDAANLLKVMQAMEKWSYEPDEND